MQRERFRVREFQAKRRKSNNIDLNPRGSEMFEARNKWAGLPGPALWPVKTLKDTVNVQARNSREDRSERSSTTGSELSGRH